MSRPRVLIVGAGIAGTCLATLLKKKGISYLLLDKAAKAPDYSYTINLERRAYKPFLSAIGISEDAFKRDVAIGSNADGALRVPRAKFENFLRDNVAKGLGVQWDSKVESIIDSTKDSSGVKTQLGSEHTADFTLAADGVHSQLRKSLLPEEDPVVLPYVAINGKRRVPVEEAKSLFENFNDEGERKKGNVRLSFSTMSPEESSSDKVSLSYTFSRPPKGNHDAVYRPDRPNAGAKDIPEEFFQELEELQPLPKPFDAILRADAVRNDRLLHWLLRIHVVPQQKLEDLWKSKRVIMFGDAAHALPVIGGGGANEAILDALALADIVERGGSPAQLYADRWSAWLKARESSEDYLKNVHASTSTL